MFFDLTSLLLSLGELNTEMISLIGKGNYCGRWVIFVRVSKDFGILLNGAICFLLKKKTKSITSSSTKVFVYLSWKYSVSE